MNNLRLILAIFLFSNFLSLYADQIDIGIAESTTVTGQINIQIRPDFDIFYPQTITAILYTVRWDDPSISITTQNFYPFFISPIGLPEEYNGYYYQSFAAIPFNSVAIDANQEYLASTFTYTNGDCAVFEIIEDNWTAANNGNLYLEFTGIDVSGNIYQSSINYGSVGGNITGNDTIVFGNSTGPLYLSDYFGSINGWQRKVDDNNWFDIPGTADLSTYSETPTAIGSYNYRVRVQNGICPEDFSDIINLEVVIHEELKLNIKVFLEGGFIVSEMGTKLNQQGYIPLKQPYNIAPWFYNGLESVISIPNVNVTDWILVELRETAGNASTATSDKIIARQAGLILKNGTIVQTDGISELVFDVTLNENLYVIISHRNHLSIMSSLPLTLSGDSYNYDFANGATKAYSEFESGQKEIATGIWGMIGGDNNANGYINDDDITQWESNTGTKGYDPSDFTLDAQVNNIDKNDVWYWNNGSSSQVPD